MDDVISRRAVRTSFLGDVDPAVAEALTQSAVVQRFQAGEVFVSETDSQWTGIVLSGIARAFLRTPAGRQVTLRHTKAGGSIGLAGLLGAGSIAAQAVTACEVLRLDNEQVMNMARVHPGLAVAIARELSRYLRETFSEIVLRDQAPVRQRLATQLLRATSERDSPGPLLVEMSHSELADAMGSAREVISRHLAQLQRDGLLHLERGRIVIIDPPRLREAAQTD
jgi:CRP-like cAMP-binding protein